MRRLRVLGVVVALVLVAAGCSDDGGGEAAGDTSTTTVAVQDSVEAYFDALATSNPSEMQMAAEQYAAPGSHAETYALTLAQMNQDTVYTGLVITPTVTVTGEAVAECFPDPADITGFGSEPPPPPSEPAEPGEPYGGERCFDIGDTTVDEDGLLTGFTVDGNELTERLALGGEPVESEGVSFTLIGGYQDALGTLNVVVEVTNTTGSEFVFRSSRGLYVNPEGEQIDSIGFAGVGAFSPGEAGNLSYTMPAEDTVVTIEAFPSAAPGGTLTYGGTLDDGNDTEVTVDIPIALTEG